MATAAFTATPRYGKAPLVVELDASASLPDGQIDSYTWDFGDGDSESSSEPTTSHEYATVGDYVITLTVTDNEAETNSTLVEVAAGLSAAPAVAQIVEQPSFETWYDYLAFSDAENVPISQALTAVMSATYVLSALTNFQMHGERCWVDTYRAPVTRYIDLAHGPVSDVLRVQRAHSCGTTLQDVEFCHESVRSVRLAEMGYVNPQAYISEPNVAFGLARSGGCQCDRIYVVSYRQASTLVPGASEAVRALAHEYVKAMHDDPACALPKRITSVTRQGVSWTILDPQTFLTEGLTGLTTIDSWLAAARRSTNQKLIMRDPLNGALLKSSQSECDSEIFDDITGSDWEKIQGDVWEWDWITSANVEDWASPTITIRFGPTSESALVAASNGDDPKITITAAEFTSSGGHLAFSVDPSATAVPVGYVWMEIEFLINGLPETRMPARMIRVIAQLGGS